MVLRYNFFIAALIALQCVAVQGAASHKERAQDTEPVDSATYQVVQINNDAPIAEKSTQEHPCNVRILLDEHELYDNGEWEFSSDEGFMLSDELIPVRTAKWDENTIRVGHARGKLYINERGCVAKKLHIIPRNGTITANDRTYHGSLFIVAHGTSWLLTNVIDLEEYLYCVLQTESWPGWPLEVNKAFAITSRTYAIAMMLRAQSQKLPYHLRNTNAHQTYEGVHDNKDLWRAVSSTKGLFLGHNNKPILAMFDACCGGIIPAHIKEFDFSKAPYLAREYPCTHCKRCKIFNWEVSYEMEQLEKIIKNHFPNMTKIKKIEITKRDRAGLITSVTVIGRKNKQVISGKKFYSMLKEVKSFFYDINIRNEMVHIKGKGYGHHLGLCQWGAREMVRDGSDYRSILQFYYPGTCLMTLV